MLRFQTFNTLCFNYVRPASVPRVVRCSRMFDEATPPLGTSTVLPLICIRVCIYMYGGCRKQAKSLRPERMSHQRKSGIYRGFRSQKELLAKHATNLDADDFSRTGNYLCKWFI
jgi:hypothetical protein